MVDSGPCRVCILSSSRLLNSFWMRCFLNSNIADWIKTTMVHCEIWKTMLICLNLFPLNQKISNKLRLIFTVKTQKQRRRHALSLTDPRPQSREKIMATRYFLRLRFFPASCTRWMRWGMVSTSGGTCTSPLKQPLRSFTPRSSLTTGKVKLRLKRVLREKMEEKGLKIWMN